MGWKRLLLSQSRRQVSSDHALPLCRLCFPSDFIVFYVVFLFLYSYGDERVVSWPVVLYLSIYLEGCSIGSMKQELIDIVFASLVVFLFLCVFLLLVAFGWKGWRLRGGPAKLSQLKLWHYFEQGRLGKVPSAMVLLLAFLTCVCRLLLGWKGCSIRSMKQELFDIVFTSSVVFTISSCCNLCERVCSCLLLMGWNGCRLVYLFAVAGVEGLSLQEGRGKSLTVSGSLSSGLLIMHGCQVWLRSLRKVGLQCPPLPSLLSLLLLGICLSMCGMGWKRLLLSQSRRQVSSENHALPLCRLCFPSDFIVFYVVFLFLYSYGDERVVSWPVVLYLSIYLERLFHREHEARAHWHCVRFFGCLSLSLCLSPIDCIWVEGLALEGRSGKALST